MERTRVTQMHHRAKVNFYDAGAFALLSPDTVGGMGFADVRDGGSNPCAAKDRRQGQVTCMKALWRHVFSALIVALLNACGPTPKEKQMVSDLTSHMKPICMGRFIMNVPQDMTFGGYVTLYYGLDKNFKTVDVRIESLNATPESMRSQTDTKAKEIDQDVKNLENKKSMLLEYHHINDHMIYLRKYRTTESASSSRHELHMLLGETQIVLQADSFEGLDPEPGFPIETTEEVQARLLKIANQIHAYGDPENAGPGFCLGTAVISSDNDEESAALYLKTDKHPDLLITIDSKALTPNGTDKPLLERMSGVTNRIDISVLRKGITSLAGMKGQEWLVKGIDDHDNLLLFFRTESIRPNPEFVRPAMSIELKTGGQLPKGPETGKYVASSLTPQEAIALWDAIISSIRARSNAVRPKDATQNHHDQ